MVKSIWAYVVKRFYLVVKHAFSGGNMKRTNRNNKPESQNPFENTGSIDPVFPKGSRYMSPGVYIDERTSVVPAITSVESAIPAFIGYTEKGPTHPVKINSLAEYEHTFGGQAHELPSFHIDGATEKITTDVPISPIPVYKMFYALDLYFTNGGGPCYIVSAGSYSEMNRVVYSELRDGLDLLEKEKEPTLILFADAQSLYDRTDYYNLFTAAMLQCSEVGNRFTLCDIMPASGNSTGPVGDAAQNFYNHIGVNNLMFGAAYYPNLQTSLGYRYAEDKVEVSHSSDEHISVLRHSDETINSDDSASKESLYHAGNGQFRLLYYEVKKMVDRVKIELPPSSAVAGAYVQTDHSRGVWKSPANISLNAVIKPAVPITDAEQRKLNVNQSGKSINAIRSFVGRGTLIWGARTIDGDNNEWRYISVRRFCSLVEESIKNGTKSFVFEPNDANTWGSVKAMIENYLTNLWREGALAAARPQDAFFVKAGLGETMTEQDIKEGRLIIELGMAVLKPAEFIIVRIIQKMQSA